MKRKQTNLRFNNIARMRSPEKNREVGNRPETECPL